MMRRDENSRWIMSRLTIVMAIFLLLTIAILPIIAAKENIINYTIRNSGMSSIDNNPFPMSDRNWSLMDAESTPEIRERFSMAYDSNSNRVILFGGWTSQGVRSNNDTWAFDVLNGTWKNMNPISHPNANTDSHMIFDTQRNQAIFFGSGPSGWINDVETWSYDYSKNEWTNLTPSTHPLSGYETGMAYDSKRDSIVLFGGIYNGGTRLNDTWIYDLNNNTWSMVQTINSPSRRNMQVMVYDSASDRIILFGGEDMYGLEDETWIFDIQNNTWTKMNVTSKPHARYWSDMIYDSKRDKVLLFGGMDFNGYDDYTWEYDYNSNAWTNASMIVSPSPRWGHSMTYDSNNGNTILFGGHSGGASNDETWVSDFGNHTWKRIDLWKSPSPRWFASMSYDSRQDRTILFGGFNGWNLDDTWSYNYNTNNWTEMFPHNHPDARFSNAMAYDSKCDSVILYGGGGSGNLFFNDTWRYQIDNNNWSNMSPLENPPTGFDTAMVYDVQSDLMILYVGNHHGFGHYEETWGYDVKSNTWTNRTGSIRPAIKSSFAMSYDLQNDRILLFGTNSHQSYSYISEFWEYDTDANLWKNITQSAQPPANLRYSMSYDMKSDRTILFAGQSNLGSYPQTWSYDYDTHNWTNLNPSISPSNRWASSMAYHLDSDRIILFGGETYQSRFMGETWVFELDSLGVLPPTVVSTFPNDGTIDTPINSSISISFSESMDITATEGAISISPSTKGAFSWDSSEKTVTFNSINDLVPSTTYFIAVSTSAKSKVDLNMQSPYLFSFKTKPVPPKVVSTIPSNGAKDINKNSNIFITFSKPMNRSSTDDAVSIIPGSINIKEWRNLDKTLTLTVNLEAEKTYTVTVSTAAKDKEGNPLTSDYTFSFTTAKPPDTSPPYIVSTTPANSTTDVPIDTVMAIQWNESMNRFSAEASFSSNPAISCMWSWTGANQICTPSTLLQSNTQYTITIAATAKDLAGNNIKAPYTFSFTTSALQDLSPPYIVSTVPARDATDVAITTNIVIEWNESMNRSSAEAAFSSSPSISCVWSWNGVMQICTLNASLEPGTNYTISIAATALDFAGNHMGIPYTFSFTTKSVVKNGNETSMTLYAIALVAMDAVLLIISMTLLKRKKRFLEGSQSKISKSTEEMAMKEEKESRRIEEKQIRSKKEVIENIRKRRERATREKARERGS